jgi:REP element-mobilizing transposase RayT
MPAFDYLGRQAYHVTIVSADRRNVLAGSVAEGVVSALRKSAEDTRFEILVYLVMPDHLHILACGADDDASLLRFVQRFKQLTGFAFKKEHRRHLWQPSFHDHALRREEDVWAVARYIVDNPARAGLVDDNDVWPYQGGVLLD